MATITATKKAATKKAVNMPSAARKRTTVNLKSMDKSPKNTAKTPFEKLFEDLLKDIYWAEQHLVDALQEMHEAATTEALKTAFEDHRHVTQKHVRRLEKYFR